MKLSEDDRRSNVGVERFGTPQKVFRSQVSLTLDGICFANIWQKVTSCLQQRGSLRSISNVCEYIVEVVARRQSCDNPLKHGYNQEDKGHILPAQWQHYMLLLSLSGVSVKLVTQTIDAHVEEMT